MCEAGGVWSETESAGKEEGIPGKNPIGHFMFQAN